MRVAGRIYTVAGTYIVFFITFQGCLIAGDYCDCTTKYMSTLPTGSHCNNTTTWNPWTLTCVNKTVNVTNSSDPDGPPIEVPYNLTPAMIQGYLNQHKYKAYDEKLYPLNATCYCNCSTKTSTYPYTSDLILLRGDDKVYTDVKVTTQISSSGSNTINKTTTVTTVNVVKGWYTIKTVTTDVTTITTDNAGLTATDTTISQVSNNKTSVWTDVIKVIGECTKGPTIGLQCYNCLYIPRMNEFEVCLEPNKNCNKTRGCSMVTYKHQGIDYIVASCFSDAVMDDREKHVCPLDNCREHLCKTDYCNSWREQSSPRLGPSIPLFVFALSPYILQWFRAI